MAGEKETEFGVDDVDVGAEVFCGKSWLAPEGGTKMGADTQ